MGQRVTVREEGDTNSVTVTTSGSAKRLLRDRNCVVTVICFKLVNYINSRESISYFEVSQQVT